MNFRSPRRKSDRASGRAGAAFLLCLCLGGLPLGAQALWPVEENPQLTVRVGRGLLLTLPGEVERVALADDTRARPQVISSYEVLLTGLAPGRTTVFVWLVNGERLMYPLRVIADLDLDLVRRTLAELDPGITAEPSADGSSVVLRGEVFDLRTAREAEARTRTLLGGKTTVLSLLRYPGYEITAEEWLEERLGAALRAIDPRIRFRRIQVGPEPDPAIDTYVLEGRVRDIQALKQAVTLAERQLGGTGLELQAAGEEGLKFSRMRGFVGGGGGTGSGSGGVLQGVQPPPAGISAKVARGLVVASASGRVVSFLEVDELPQVLVSIRAIEIDRTKAKKAGINLRFDNEDFSFQSLLSPGVGGLPAASGQARRASVSGIDTNLVAAFVDQATSVVAAIDFLEDKALARSVAEPNVLTLSGEPATVVVGGEVPIPTSAVNQVAAVQGFLFQDFGVRLDIRPTVVDDDLIALEVVPSIIRRSIALGVGDVPGFQVQSVQTTARVQAGESLVLGGLLSFEEGLEERKIPGLGWLPGVGRWRRKSRNERELLFVISPRIVETPRSERPPEPVTMPELAELAPPELDWSDDRDGWREDFEPQELRRDGVPPSFLPAAATATEEEAVWTAESAEPAPAAEPVPPPPPAAEPELLWEEPRAEAPSDAAAQAGPPPSGPVQAVVDALPCLNLRRGPGTWQPPVDCIAAETLVEVLAEAGTWKRVRLPDGREGWMAGDYLYPISYEENPAVRLDQLSSERDTLERQIDGLEDSDDELEEQLRQIQEEIERIRAASAGETEDPG